MRRCLAIVLAAGNGTRMQSSSPKVLHKIAGLPLISHVTTALADAGADQLAVVVGREAEQVSEVVTKQCARALIYHQEERLGTAHATLAAREAQPQSFDDVIIAFGDTPLIEPQFLVKMRNVLAEGADLVIMSFRAENPSGYGRVLMEDERLVAIVEDNDATYEQKQITLCNGGVIAVTGHHLLELLDSVDNDNAKGEYYLTSIVSLAVSRGLKAAALEVPLDTVIGINNRCELAHAERIWQERKRRELMLSGVTLIAPETVFFSYDTVIGRDVLIEPHVFFGPNVEVKSQAIIRAFSHVADARIAKNAEIGPFARLRHKATLGEGVKIGNFCEVKNSSVGDATKINHLSYIGDATIGTSVNIGAGTITCNYDGNAKWPTTISDRAFVGSNTSLVAPVKIGEGAYIGSGSVITLDVPPNALAIARTRQENKAGYAQKIRNRTAAQKK